MLTEGAKALFRRLAAEYRQLEPQLHRSPRDLSWSEDGEGQLFKELGEAYLIERSGDVRWCLTQFGVESIGYV
jgi:hypothetical protein